MTTENQNRVGSDLHNRAVLMRLSISIPGEERMDPQFTQQVKAAQALGGSAGKWVTKIYPPEALAEIKRNDTLARELHNALTLPFDQGIGILPARLIEPYSERMRHLKQVRENLIENGFLKEPAKWVRWARREHNGLFNPALYPGCKWVKDATPEERERLEPIGLDALLDPEVFRQAIRGKFDFGTVPLPVPNAAHFSGTVAELLGTDVNSVNMRVEDAEREGQRELMRRLLDPVRAMAAKLAEQPKVRKNGKQAEDIIFRDTLVTNLREICAVAPALNLADDPQIAAAIKEVKALAVVEPETLRDDKAMRTTVQKQAASLCEKLSAFNL